jgi:hypothetical protein
MDESLLLGTPIAHNMLDEEEALPDGKNVE